mgnify:CR=1 FL=1
MRSFTYVITDEVGMHARPASLLARQAMGFQSRCVIHAGGKDEDITGIFRVIGLKIRKGTEVTVTAEGPDEDAAIAALEETMKEYL